MWRSKLRSKPPAARPLWLHERIDDVRRVDHVRRVGVWRVDHVKRVGVWRVDVRGA